jgi:hypothetical protein
MYFNEATAPLSLELVALFNQWHWFSILPREIVLLIVHLYTTARPPQEWPVFARWRHALQQIWSNTFKVTAKMGDPYVTHFEVDPLIKLNYPLAAQCPSHLHTYHDAQRDRTHYLMDVEFTGRTRAVMKIRDRTVNVLPTWLLDSTAVVNLDGPALRLAARTDVTDGLYHTRRTLSVCEHSLCWDEKPCTSHWFRLPGQPRRKTSLERRVEEWRAQRDAEEKGDVCNKMAGQ